MNNSLADHIDEIEALAEPGGGANKERLRELAASLAGACLPWRSQAGEPETRTDEDTAYSLLRASLLLAPELASRDLNQSLRSIAAALERIPREVGEELVMDMSAFRHLAQQWEADCKGLPEPLCPAQPVLESVEAYLHDLYTLKRAADGSGFLARCSGGFKSLAESLRGAEQEAADGLRSTPIRPRLWALLPEARRLGLSDLLPSLREVLAGGNGSSSDAFVEAAERLATRESRFPRNLMWAAAHGRLADEDFTLVKRLISRNLARWGEAYRHALHHDGFPALAYLEKTDDTWTAPPSFRLPPSAVRGQLLLGAPEAPQRALPPPAEVDVQRPNLPANIEPESLFVASARVELADLDVRVYGDERGLWCLAARNGDARKVRCSVTREVATGWHAQIPIMQASPHGGFPKLRFRPGPLRPLLASADFPFLDRACSRRAYVITVGESSLRNLFGWELRERAARLHPIAREAGVRDGRELLRLLFRDDALSLPWVARLRTTDRPAERGLMTLGDVVRSIPDLAPEELSAEIATVEGLTGDLAPADGDEFVLIPTRTATSVLAAQIARCRLAAKFPHSRIRISACGAMKQRRDLSETRCELPQEPLDAAYNTADEEVGRLLVDEAADPVLVVSGGAKWESEAMLDLGADRRLPVAYRFEHGARPVVFRWDWMPVESRRKRDEPLVIEEPGSRYVVMTVGISLITKEFGKETGIREPSVDQLMDWVRKKKAEHAPLYTLCAELTGFEAWRRSRRAKGAPDVALIRTRSAKAGAYAPGQVCAEVVRRLLKEQGARVHTADTWDILDFSDIKKAGPEEQMAQLERELRRPMAQCLDEVIRAAEVPDVLASGGQKLAASALHLLGRVRGCRVYLAPEPEEGEEPRLWRVWAPGTRPELERGDVLDAEYVQVA